MLHGYVGKLGVTKEGLASMASGMILAVFTQCTPNFSRHPIRMKALSCDYVHTETEIMVRGNWGFLLARRFHGPLLLMTVTSLDIYIL